MTSKKKKKVSVTLLKLPSGNYNVINILRIGKIKRQFTKKDIGTLIKRECKDTGIKHGEVQYIIYEVSEIKGEL